MKYTQEQIDAMYNEREKWFQERIGKRVFRSKTDCNCDACDEVYRVGVIIDDKQHASYLHCCEAELPIKYFDTKEDVEKHENAIK